MKKIFCAIAALIMMMTMAACANNAQQAGGNGGEVCLAVVVEGFAVDEAEHGNGNVVAARVIAQQRAQGAARAQHAGFEQLVLLDAGHALQILAEHLGVEGLGIELRHAMSLLSMGR